jgi:hypothetical protein
VSLSSVSFEVPEAWLPSPTRSGAASDDVLFAGTGGLDHLVAGAVALLEQAVAEVDCGVVDDFGLAVREQVDITAVRWDETISRGPFLVERTQGAKRT